MANSNDVGTSGAQAPTLVGVICVKIIEDKASHDFYFSERLLERHAPHFAEICKGRDGKDTLMEITDYRIETFTIFAAWLDQSKDYISEPLREDPTSGSHWTACMPLIELYVFACDCLVSQLAEDALDRLTSLISQTVNVMELVPTVQEINYAYAATAAESPLRLILVDAFCAADPNYDYAIMAADCEFLVDVIFKMKIQYATEHAG